MAAYCGQECIGLLDVHPVQGCTDAGAVIDKAAKLIQPDSSYVFKVVGENRFVAVVNSPDAALAKLNSSMGGQLEVTCSPLYKYEDFAKGTLELDTSLCGDAPELLVTEKDFIFWLHFKVEYTGLTFEELLALWKEEATGGLAGRLEGTLKFVSYKTVFQREVHAFLVADSANQIDGVSFSLPLMKKNGENLQVTSKNVRVVSKQ